jgi:hypothetical protein
MKFTGVWEIPGHVTIQQVALLIKSNIINNELQLLTIIKSKHIKKIFSNKPHVAGVRLPRCSVL